MKIKLTHHQGRPEVFDFDTREELELWVIEEGEKRYGNSNFFFCGVEDFQDPTNIFTADNPPASEFDFWWYALGHDMSRAEILN